MLDAKDFRTIVHYPVEESVASYDQLPHLQISGFRDDAPEVREEHQSGNGFEY
jgi:hypothetical protein